MSISELLGIGLQIVCFGLGVSLWVYATRYCTSEDVMLTLGNALRPATPPTETKQDY